MQLTQATLNGIMAGIIETGNEFDPAAVFVGVFVSIADAGLATVIGDVTAPPTSVAVRQAVTAWSAQYSLVDGRRVVDGPLMDFRPASIADATVVTGWFLADAITAGNLMAFGYFAAPIVLPDENAVANLIVRLTVDPAGRWDASISYNG